MFCSFQRGVSALESRDNKMGRGIVIHYQSAQPGASIYTTMSMQINLKMFLSMFGNLCYAPTVFKFK